MVFYAIAESISQWGVNRMSFADVKHSYKNHNPSIPDEWIIARNIKLRSNRSCQRCILEACAIKMSDSDRNSLIQSEHDELFKLLRRPKEGQNNYMVSLGDWIIKQRYYRESEDAQRQVVRLLFEIIKANPHAFLQMVA